MTCDRVIAGVTRRESVKKSQAGFLGTRMENALGPKKVGER